MKVVYAIPIFAVVIMLGISLAEANAQLVGNEAYLAEGSGFAVTEESIKISEVDFLMILGEQKGSTTSLVVEDGFVTLDEMDFTVSDVTGSVLRDGRFIRIVGTADNVIGEVTLSLFGRLIEDTSQGSVYSFTGRISQGALSNKIIYTAKISPLTGSFPIPTTTIPTTTTPTTTPIPTDEKELLVRIAPNAHIPGFGIDYVDAYAAQAAAVKIQSELGAEQTRARYFSPNRASVVPGTTITFQNDDTVSHTILSAKRDTNARGIGHDFRIIPDGRFATNEILPGQSGSMTIDQIGFIFLYDREYPWMRMDVVSFPDKEQDVIGFKKERTPYN